MPVSKKRKTAKKKANPETVTKPMSFLVKTTKARGVTLKKDKTGYYVCTHRYRSASYKTIASIPKSVIEYTESTG